ncbi:hypothetical protein CABS01_01494 [Colletotrichum abscissum]|uniref:uncharacterized protein n=1 Tax=Colletotrichum abscissum TaxID=1671311 RepID=UPI0027D49221|nr:uncharacterized protein CABS01_01494 [Colletotrichum abscissum]KAK1495687.1 hypothetical protein CABS01_01494 [Colletotrichum abscissum]
MTGGKHWHWQGALTLSRSHPPRDRGGPQRPSLEGSGGSSQFPALYPISSTIAPKSPSQPRTYL